jgi:hypothetical protein
MTTPATPDTPSLEQHVSTLEAENRDLQWRVSHMRFLAAQVGVGLLAYAVFFALYARPVKASVVEVERLILRDPAGRRRPADALCRDRRHLPPPQPGRGVGGQRAARLVAPNRTSTFAYRHPGLHLLPVRVYRAAGAFDLPETPHYAGCRSWVELDQDLPTDGATPCSMTRHSPRYAAPSMNG